MNPKLRSLYTHRTAGLSPRGGQTLGVGRGPPPHELLAGGPLWGEWGGGGSASQNLRSPPSPLGERRSRKAVGRGRGNRAVRQKPLVLRAPDDHSTLSFPLPPSALCTIFAERGLPCPVTPPCVSLSLCPVSSGLSTFVLS